MKSWRLLLLAALSALSLILVACGNDSNGTAPGGYPTYPTNPGGSGDNGGGFSESDINLSYFGKNRISSTSGVKALYRGFLPNWNNAGSGIFNATELWSGNFPAECSEWTFFKPSCAPTFTGYWTGGACDYPYEIYGGPYDCSTYNNDKMGIWFERKSSGKLRIRLMANADSVTTYGYHYFAIVTEDDIDPNDINEVQSYNGGRGLEITIGGVHASSSFNKIIKIYIDDLTGMDNDSDYTDVIVKYGTSGSLTTILSTRMEKMPLL